MCHISIAIISILICCKYGDWRNWRNYYPTILFLILSSLACFVFTYNHPLWLYKSKLLGKTFSDLLICITAYPSTVILFFSRMPKGKKDVFLHITVYVAIFTITEYIALKLGYFSHYNGWNIWYSLGFNYSLFLMLMLHQKKPLYAWLIALIMPHILFFIMKIPYSSIM